MSQISERISRISQDISRVFTGLAAGLRNFTPRFDRVKTAFARKAIDPVKAPAGPSEGGVKAADTSAETATSELETGGRLARPPLKRLPERKDDSEEDRRRMEAAPGGNGAEPPRRHADAAPREAATGSPATTAATVEAAQTAAATPEDAMGPAAAATVAAARPEQGSGERANPAAPQDLPEGTSPTDVRRVITQESRQTGDSPGVTGRASRQPPRVASPRHGQVGDLRNRVDQVVNEQARIAQQLLQLSDQAGAAWRAAQEVTRQLQQVNRTALKR